MSSEALALRAQLLDVFDRSPDNVTDVLLQQHFQKRYAKLVPVINSLLSEVLIYYLYYCLFSCFSTVLRYLRSNNLVLRQL
jgi:hypothetical protein